MALPAFAAKWKEEAEECLRDVVSAQIKLDDSVDPLTLAAGGMFFCSLCQTACQHPKVFSHYCKKRLGRRLVNGRDYYTELARTGFCGGKWWPQDFAVNFKFLQHVANMFGVDPTMATIKDMDESPVRLICKQHKEVNVVHVMSWRDMVSKISTAMSPNDNLHLPYSSIIIESAATDLWRPLKLARSAMQSS
jgi:hypothetical protein